MVALSLSTSVLARSTVALAASVIAGPNPGPQTWALRCPCSEILYGGARGGGKTMFLILDWLRHAGRRRGQARGLLVRRTYEGLKDFILDARKVMGAVGWVWREHKKQFIGPDGSILTLAHLDHDKDAEGYQGWNLSWLSVEEAGQFPRPDPINLLRGTLRIVVDGQEPEMRLTANPGGPGHRWLRERYVDPAPPTTPIREYITLPDGRQVTTIRVFIPARLRDNPIADTPQYQAQLARSGPSWLVKAWLEGDWNVQPAGGLFEVDKINRGPLPRLERLVQGWDGAFTVKTQNDESAGMTVGRDENKRLWIPGLWHGRHTIDVVAREIVGQAKAHGCRWVRAEGGPFGHAIDPLVRDLQRNGIPVAGKPTADREPCHLFHFSLTSHLLDKVSKNAAFAAAVNLGMVWVPDGVPWWPALRDQLLTFDGRDGKPDDLVDAGGIAFRELDLIPAAMPLPASPASLPDRSTATRIINRPTAPQQGPRVMWKK